MKVRKIIADALGVTEASVRSWENGIRKPSTKYLFMIEELTDKKVTRKELRPDLF